MKRYDGILLCSDFDLTLTSDTYKYRDGDDFFAPIPKNNIAAVNEFVARGGTFAVVSGRNPDEIALLRDVMPIADLCVCSNGTAVYSISGKRPVVSFTMGRECEKVIEYFSGFADEYSYLRVTDGDTPDCFDVCGRGELHLSILIETMRRQGYEFQVSKPEVIYKEIDGVKCEPIERMVADVPQAYAGAVIEKIGRRRGVLEKMEGSDRVRLEFLVPSRGLFGYRSEFMTDTRGEGIMSAVFEKYEPFRGDIPHRSVGALIVYETGETTQYGLFYTQERGTLFVGSQVPVYAGMICGANSRPGDIVCNVCRKKHVTNTRNAASAEDSLRLVSVHPLTLEECLEFIDDDELLEITPKSLRMRKRQLSHEQRAKNAARGIK